VGLPERILARYQAQDLPRKVAARYFEAFEFPTDEAREKYLKEHPGADPSKHTVNETEKALAKTDEAQPEKKKPSFLDKLKGVSEAARAALKKAPEAARKFFTDENHRRKVLQDLSKTMDEAPGKYAKKLIETAKHEVHEFQEAGSAVRDVLNGKKLSDEQKKAVKTVAIHMGITLTAAALGTSGVLAGLAFTGKALAKHIALKAAARSLGHMHTMGELGHIGEGVAGILDKFAATKEEHDPDEILAALVLRSVKEELANLDEEDLAEIMNSLAEAPTKKAAIPVPDLMPLLEQAEGVLKRFRAWIRTFPQVLHKAQQEAVNLDESGLVWQDQFGPYWKESDPMFEVLASIDEQIEGIWLKSDRAAVQTLANLARGVTSEPALPRKARLEYAFGNPQFRDHPDRRGHIAYEISRLEEWARAFENWTEDSLGILRETIRKARRLV